MPIVKSNEAWTELLRRAINVPLHLNTCAE